MKRISDQIKSGAKAFLITEYKYLAAFVAVVFIILVLIYTLDPPSVTDGKDGDRTDGIRYGVCYLAGALLSAAPGWGGMSIATDTNVRTTQAADKGGEPCPPDGANGWAGWWFSADHLLVAFPETEQGRHSLKVMEFYNKYIVADASSETFQSITLNYTNGARFAVARECILRRPLSYYKDLLRELSRHVSPIDGYYMEAFW